MSETASGCSPLLATAGASVLANLAPMEGMYKRVEGRTHRLTLCFGITCPLGGRGWESGPGRPTWGERSLLEDGTGPCEEGRGSLDKVWP